MRNWLERKLQREILLLKNTGIIYQSLINNAWAAPLAKLTLILIGVLFKETQCHLLWFCLTRGIFSLTSVKKSSIFQSQSLRSVRLGEHLSFLCMLVSQPMRLQRKTSQDWVTLHRAHNPEGKLHEAIMPVLVHTSFILSHDLMSC